MAITLQSPGPEYGPNKQDLELGKEPLPASPGCQGGRLRCWHRVWAGAATGAVRPWERREAGQRNSASNVTF